MVSILFLHASRLNLLSKQHWLKCLSTVSKVRMPLNTWIMAYFRGFSLGWHSFKWGAVVVQNLTQIDSLKNEQGLLWHGSSINLVWNLGVTDPGLKKFDFSRQIFYKKNCSGNFKKFRFSRQKLAIYSYFWINYSISLQSHHFWTYFMVHVHDKIY